MVPSLAVLPFLNFVSCGWHSSSCSLLHLQFVERHGAALPEWSELLLQVLQVLGRPTACLRGNGCV